MPTSPQRVFIVDDSPIVRERLVRLVNELPQATVIGEAAQPAEAIRDIRQLHPDLVILDISMPGGSGMHVLESVKKDQPGIRIIMLTNFAYDQYRDKCRQLGADFFFDKSTEFDQIAQVIQTPAPSHLAPFPQLQGGLARTSHREIQPVISSPAGFWAERVPAAAPRISPKCPPRG